MAPLRGLRTALGLRKDKKAKLSPKPTPFNNNPVKRKDPGARLYAAHPPLKQIETEINHRVDKRRKLAATLLPKGGIGAEIGVFTGLFSPHLTEATEAKKVFLVDPWHTIFGEHYPPWGPYTANGQLETKYAIEAVKARTEHLGNRVEIVVAKSLDWLATLPDDFLDFVYLDTTHAYKDTLDELDAIFPKLKEHGIVMCDDVRVDRNSKHHACFRAVRDYTHKGEMEIFHFESQQAFLRKTLS